MTSTKILISIAKVLANEVKDCQCPISSFLLQATAYNYFASSIDHSVPAAKPKLLSEDEVAEQKRLLNQQGEAGASAWNFAGLWTQCSYMI